MSLISRRSSHASAGGTSDAGLVAPLAAGTRRLLNVTVLVLGILALTACGMNVQTNKPYTPAEGVNVDVSSSGNANEVVHVRNLGIVSRGAGEGILSATLVGTSADALTGVSGTATKLDGSAGSAMSAVLSAPVELTDGSVVVLTAISPLITFNSADLEPGLTAVLTLQFRNAGQVTVTVPVLDGNQPQYRTITPSPTPAAQSASPSPSPSK